MNGLEVTSYNYNYPTELKDKWKKYQTDNYCLTESHAVINLINMGLNHITIEPVEFNVKTTERFTMKFPNHLIARIDKEKKNLKVNTRIKAIHLLIAKGLSVINEK